MSRRALLAALPLLLTACAITPHQAPAPSLDVPVAWRTPATQQAVLAQDWWRTFGDARLNALVARALAHNGDIKVARSRLQEYQERIKVADSARMPSLNLAVSPSRGRSIGPFGEPVEITSYTGSVQASYELDLAGRVAAAGNIARLDALGQQAALEAVHLAVAASTASAYLNLVGLDAQLALAQATLASRERSVALARRQFEVGYSSRLDMAQAESELHATRAVVPQLERAISLQEQALNLLLGASPGPIERGTALQALQVPQLAAELPSALLRRRPDIAQAEQALAANDALLALARDQMLPSIHLNASLGVQGNTIGRLLRSPVDLWSVGASVLAPLFDAGRLRAQAEIAATQRDRALFTYETVVRTAFAETENALASVESLNRQLTQASARQKATQEVLRVAHNRYANGYASYLEELDAQRNAFNADLTVLQLRANLLAAHVDLARALGGGWQAK